MGNPRLIVTAFLPGIPRPHPAICSLLLVLLLTAATPAPPHKPLNGTDAADTLTGVVTLISPEIFVLMDNTGKGTLLQIQKNTSVDPNIREGDRVTARVTPEGHVLLLKKTDSGGEQKPPPGSPSTSR